MDCQHVQEWLLHSDITDPELSGPSELAGHLRSCSACRELAAELAQLEQNWREIPVPSSAATAKAAFLDQLEPQARTLPAAAKRSRRFVLRSAIAASLFLAAGVGGLLLLDQSRANAAPGVVDRLIDWNLELAEAPSSAGRTSIYAERVYHLRTELAGADLPESERAFAEELLANGQWLAENDDPTAEADRFTEVADALLTKMDAASAAGNAKELRRLTRLYARVAAQGIASRLEKALATNALDFEHKRRLEKVILRDEQRQRKLQVLLEQSPAASRKEIKKALDLPRKPNKRKDAAAEPNR